MTARLPQLLAVTVLAVASTTGLAACGGESLTDVAPRSTPNLAPPDGGIDPAGSGSGDVAGSIADLPTVTTGPTPPASDGGAGSGDSTTSDPDGSADDSSVGSDGSSSTTGNSGGASGGASVSPGSGSSGNGDTSGGGTAGNGDGNGGATTGGGDDSGSSSGSSGSGSSGGAAPSEFNEFCQTNPGVCR